MKSRSVALYAQGIPLWEITEETGVSPSTIRRLAREAGLPPRKCGPQPNAYADAVLALYKDGASYETICEKFGVSKTAIHRIAKRNQVLRHPRLKDKVVKLAIEGKTRQEIADTLGITRKHVRNYYYRLEL